MIEKDQLDRAIDQVANRMVSVPENDQMLDTIVARLPERSKDRWFAGFAPYALAGLAVVIFAIVSFDGRSDVRSDGRSDVRSDGRSDVRSPIVPRTFDQGSPIARSAPGTPVERSSERPSNDRPNVRQNVRQNDTFDRDYGLPPVNAPVEIAFKSIAVEDTLSVPASELAPLVLTDLPSLDDSSRD